MNVGVAQGREGLKDELWQRGGRRGVSRKCRKLMKENLSLASLYARTMVRVLMIEEQDSNGCSRRKNESSGHTDNRSEARPQINQHQEILTPFIERGEAIEADS